MSGTRARFKVRSDCIADAIAALLTGGLSEAELGAATRRAGGEEAELHFRYFLELFKRRLLIRYEWRHSGRVHVTLEPLLRDFRLAETAPPENPAAVALSRFAYARQDRGRFVLECPDAGCRLVLQSSSVVDWLGRLLGANDALDDGFRAFTTLLWQASFIGPPNEEGSKDRATWEFHDRLFHSRSRQGLGVSSGGGTYRFKGKFPSPGALKLPVSRERIALDVPQAHLLSNESLFCVIERRRSIREMDDERPIALTQLGNILFHVARVKETRQGPPQDVLFKPVPSGGAIHELEFYVAVRICDGLEPGFYHYSGGEHALYRLPAPKPVVESLLRDGGASMGQPDRPPQTVLILASRFPRLAWKYEGMAYRVTLLNAGVVFGFLYLVATAMNLSCCALGNGDSACFAKAAGLDPTAETSVAEFALSSAP
jgi:oxazoline/thiazoline dehydrogenase